MKHFIIKISLAGLIAVSCFSCSKKIEEVYNNPNADVRIPPEQLLPQIVSAMVGNYGGHGTLNDSRFIGAYIQNWHYYVAQSNYDRMGYTNSAADVSQSTWRMHYYDIGQNNMKMIQWAIEEKKWDYAGVGKAIFAWSWLTLTDYYGDVILKEAFNTDLLTFKYDTQDEVYNYVRQLCFESLDYLNNTGDASDPANLAKGDAFLYNGDVNKWKKFVYGILARWHHHQSNKTAYKADSVIYYCNLSLADNTDNAMLKFASTQITATHNYFGPLRNNLVVGTTVSPTAIRQGAYIADLMSGVNTAFTGVTDPRAWYILRGNANGTIKGVQLNKGQGALPAGDRPENFWGVAQASANNTAPATDANCRFIFRNNAPVPVMTAAEIQFLKAEAAILKNDKATALDAYKKGIQLHFDMLTGTYNVNIPAGKEITPAIRDGFLNNVAVVPATAGELTLTKVMLQKYIAMFGFGVLETWVDMRRYHYIDKDPGTGEQVYKDFNPPAQNTDDMFPDNQNKLVYRVRPRFNSEYVWNVLELQRIGADQNNYHTKEMWFSQK